MSKKNINHRKLKNILEKADIIVMEYFLIEGECALLKCFLAKTFEFLLIYVPSKYRSAMSIGTNSYGLETIEENTDADDYSKTGKNPDIDAIDGERSINIYTELTNKYQKNITIDGEEEPVQRKIKRQLSRLKIPFSRLSYDLAIQNGKSLCLSFGDDINLFNIKGYMDLGISFMYVINLKDFIEKIEDISTQIEIIKKQFNGIIKKISISNLEGISDDKKLQIKIISKIDSYQKYIDEYQELYIKSSIMESDIIKKFKSSLSKLEDPLKKHSLEEVFQKEFDSNFKTKMEIVDRGIQLISSLQKNLLHFEEISFDNSVMIQRVEKNFDLLSKYFD